MNGNLMSQSDENERLFERRRMWKTRRGLRTTSTGGVMTSEKNNNKKTTNCSKTQNTSVSRSLKFSIVASYGHIPSLYPFVSLVYPKLSIFREQIVRAYINDITTTILEFYVRNEVFRFCFK